MISDAVTHCTATGYSLYIVCVIYSIITDTDPHCVAWICHVGQANGDIRLVDTHPTSRGGRGGGRLEIFVNNEWGTVCNDDFGIREGNVACNQLGYISATNVGIVKTLG